MLFTSVPAEAFASTGGTEGNTSTNRETPVSQSADEGMAGTVESAPAMSDETATPLAEDPSLRSETVKHFINDDGTYTAVNYFVPVHYQKEGSSQWREIDNTEMVKLFCNIKQEA